MSQITVSFRGSLRHSASPGDGSYTSVRLLAGLYELNEGDAMRQINQAVEIAEVDSLGYDGNNDPDDGAAWGKGYNFDVEFHGLKSTAVEHPLLVATAAHSHNRPQLCLGVRMLGERRSGASEDVEVLEVLAFGGVIIDTQGVALGSEVHATVLMFECASGTQYN